MGRISHAERQRRYRVNLNSDPIRRAAYLAKKKVTWERGKTRGTV